MDDNSELYIYLALIDNTIYFQHNVSDERYEFRISYDIWKIILTQYEMIKNIIIYEINPILNELYIIYIELINFDDQNIIHSKYNICNLSNTYINLLKMKREYILGIYYHYEKKTYIIQKSYIYNNNLNQNPLFTAMIPTFTPPFSEIYKNIIFWL